MRPEHLLAQPVPVPKLDVVCLSQVYGRFGEVAIGYHYRPRRLVVTDGGHGLLDGLVPDGALGAVLGLNDDALAVSFDDDVSALIVGGSEAGPIPLGSEQSGDELFEIRPVQGIDVRDPASLEPGSANQGRNDKQEFGADEHDTEGYDSGHERVRATPNENTNEQGNDRESLTGELHVALALSSGLGHGPSFA